MTKTTTVHHNKKVNFLRYILRRKQCAILTLVEVALLVMLLSFCIGAYFGYQIYNKQRIEIDKENAVIDRYADNITFAHCKFIKVVDFNTQFCKNRVGVVAFAYRYHALENKEDNDKTCLDINEQIYCHEYLIKNNMVNPYPLEITPAYQNGCPGFGNATFNEFDINKTQTVTVMIPQDLEIFKKENRTIVHVQELFIKCPKCTPDQTKPAKSGNTDCTRTIKTIEKGWPWFAENCKEGEVVECPATKSSTTLDPLSEGATTTLGTAVEPQNMFNLLNEQQQEMMIKDDF